MNKAKALSIVEGLLIFVDNTDVEKRLIGLHGFIKEQPEIIVCKDCKWLHDGQMHWDCTNPETRITIIKNSIEIRSCLMCERK